MPGEPLRERAEAAAQLVADLPARRRITVVADADVDGIAAAAVLARAFAATGRRFVVRLTRRRDPEFFDALLRSEPSLIITADLGASLVPRFVASRVPTIVLDHHEPAGDGDGATLVHVNPHLVGEDGSTTASGAAVSFVFAAAMLDAHGGDAQAILPFALLGAWGDRYHGATLDAGLHARLWARARDAAEGGAPVAWGAWMPGSGDEPDLASAVAAGLDPVHPRFAGDAGMAREALLRLGVDPKLQPAALDGAARSRLASWLVAALLAAGAEPTLAGNAVAPRPVFAPGAAPLAGFDVAAVALRVDAAARRGEETTALAALLGSADAWRSLASGLEEYRAAVLEPLAHNAAGREGATKLGPAHLVRVPNGRYAGPVADRLMAWTGLGVDPVVVLGPVPRGVKASLRARPAALGREPWRLDTAASVAARVAGGLGGGHRLAAGALVPAEREAAFLERLAAALGQNVEAGPVAALRGQEAP